MPATPQLGLRDAAGELFAANRGRRTLFGIEASLLVADLDTYEELRAEIDCGKILWAWDLSGSEADRLWLRVWNRSLICYRFPDKSQPQDLQSVLWHVLPHTRETLRCSEVYRAFGSSPQHVLKLIADGLLERLPGDLAPKESPTVTRASVIKLFSERRIK